MLRYLIAAAVLALVATAVVVFRPGDGGSGPPPAAQRPPSEPSTAQRSEPVTGQPTPTNDSGGPFIWSVSDDGRHFVDQHGDPILVRGDSPWSLTTDLTAEEAETYLADRGARDVNAVIVSLLGPRWAVGRCRCGPRSSGPGPTTTSLVRRGTGSR